MKLILEFNLPEEREEAKMANQAGAMASAIMDIHTHLFRPLNKHGYPSPELNKLANTKVGRATIEALQKLYQQILDENELEGL